ncbi:hypothetical protein [Streptomyces goshikiensis]
MKRRLGVPDAVVVGFSLPLSSAVCGAVFLAVGAAVHGVRGARGSM